MELARASHERPLHSGATLISVQVGRVAPLGPEGVPSAFVKCPVDGPIAVMALGLAGDQQADLRVHGGPEKAVYGYALSSYAPWRHAFPEHDALLVPGAFGENLTIGGMDEETVHIGDVVRVGSATLQVTQPRQPCFKFALRFAEKRMPKAMIRNGRSGWYYRVVEAGVLAAGDRTRSARATESRLAYSPLQPLAGRQVLGASGVNGAGQPRGSCPILAGDGRFCPRAAQITMPRRRSAALVRPRSARR